MNTFTLVLQDATHTEQLANVETLVARDASGSFSLQAGSERYMTELAFGLARFRTSDGQWHFLALPGALLYVGQNVLTLCTRRYFRSDSEDEINTHLRETLANEEEELRRVRSNVRQLEDTILKRLYEMNQRISR